MPTIHYGMAMSDDDRRAALYQGDLFVCPPSPAARALVDHGKRLVQAAFAPLDPLQVHEFLSKEETAQVLGRLKPEFIHHPESKRLIRALLSELGCDETQVYFDVPRLRSSYPSGHLTTGIAYAFPHHRDTWYSAPQCQLNWWLPIWDATGENGLLFTPRYFSRPIENNSSAYNYYQWNATSRGAAPQQIDAETRILPQALVPVDRADDLHIGCPAGGLILFSASHLHASVPNMSTVARYSIDFRTVHIDDARERRGAPNVDVHCTGHTMRDYLRMNDLAHLPAEIVELYDDGTEREGVVYYDAEKR